jgi:hypothetical protein
MMTVIPRGGDPPYPPMFAVCAPDRKKRDFIGGADGEPKPRGAFGDGEVTPLVGRGGGHARGCRK